MLAYEGFDSLRKVLHDLLARGSGRDLRHELVNLFIEAFSGKARRLNWLLTVLTQSRPRRTVSKSSLVRAIASSRLPDYRRLRRC
jgi:hypothetical protein